MSNKPVMTWSTFLEILQEVETGKRYRKGKDLIGDEGKSFGPLQISEAAKKDGYGWIRGLQVENGINSYNLQDLHHSRIIAFGYLNRYASKAMAVMDKDAIEKMARIWNGGPNGYRKKATLPYWEKFKEIAKSHGVVL